ncbi:hypothetical protein [Polyangium fumosum]|uniref:Uncharacterized protein n=1 Tax=Polyangium fumosum TaxID=889272 RepID=A0A4U1JJ40_9BACT|nr:hypothetical protein [Polyangium fumosum]TKD12731.1 hypothetical protein E8A74_02995 [Polyangium fumosum]
MRTRLLLGPALALATITLATRVNAQQPDVAPPPPPPPPSATNPAPPPPAVPTPPQANPFPAPPAGPLTPTPGVPAPPPPPGSAANGASLPPPPAPPPGAGPYAPYPPGPYAPYPPGPYPQPPPNGAWGRGYALPLPGWSTEVPTQKVKRWYGWQTLIGVVAGDLVSVVGMGTPITYVGIAGHVLTGPIVHWAHGHVGKGFASLGLNVGLPLGGGLLGLMAGAGTGYEAIGYVAIGALVGYVAAPALDMAVFSTETVEAPQESVKGARAILPSSVTVVPMMGQDRMGLSVMGLF